MGVLEPFNLLPPPNCDMINNNTIAWFTQAGNDQFKDAIKSIIKDIENHGRCVVCLEQESLPTEDILYSDSYQVILRR